MLNLPPSVRIFLCMQPTDMRRSFDGLSMMVEQIMRQAPYSGHLFVFRNRRRDRVKILYWDRTGYAIWYKRLEKGVFSFPASESVKGAEVQAMELALLLEGIDLTGVRRRRRYKRPDTKAAGPQP